MRLIDADKITFFDCLAKSGNSVCCHAEGIISKSGINMQPTVKAIPIDKPFLKMSYGDYVVYNKKWLVNHLQTEWNILQGKEYQPAIPIEWIKNYASHKASKDLIDCYWHFWEDDVLKMVADWEKETALDKQIEQWEIDDDMDWEMIQREEENEKG